MNGYALFSKFYRQMAVQRKHFDDQFEVLQDLLHRYDVNPSSCILDAACGTGDVPLRLHDAGYKNISAVDGSAEMLDQVTPRQREIMSVERCDWTRLSEHFGKHGRFDLIYIMGHSLPHLPVSELTSVLVQVRSGLNPGGQFFFDIRPWERDSDGALRQPGRPPSADRDLGTVQIDGKDYLLVDRVNYDGSVQTVTYLLTETGSPGSTLRTQVSYSIYSQEEATEYLVAAGFPRSGIEVTRHPKWSYLVIVAKNNS